jgi:hypothetical protein
MTAQRSRVLSWVGVAALAGIGAFGFVAWQSVTVEEAPLNEALRRFTEIRSRLAGMEPMMQVDASGVVSRRQTPEVSPAMHSTRLRVLAYRAPQERLVHADAPFWFLKMKGPAVQYSLRDTGLDLERLGVTPAELQQYGVCVVLDETRANGDRVLVWTE